MARHNLAGWMRDVQSLLRLGTEEELEQFYALIEDVNVRLDDWLDVGHRKDSSDVESSEDDADDAPDDNQGGLDGGVSERREADAPRARRHDAGGTALRAAPRRLERQLGGVPGFVGDEAEPLIVTLRDGSLGASRGGLKPSRRDTVEVPLDNLRNRAAKAPTRKGVSRGKKRTTRKAKR